MAKCFPPRLKSRKKCQRCRCFRLSHKILLALHTLQLKTSTCEGVTEKALVNYVSCIFKIDGDVEDQVRSVLTSLIKPGFVIRNCNKFQLVGPSARIQCSPCNSSRRQKAIEHVSNVYLMCGNENNNKVTFTRERSNSREENACVQSEPNSRPCSHQRLRGRACKRRGGCTQKKSSQTFNYEKCDLEENQKE